MESPDSEWSQAHEPKKQRWCDLIVSTAASSWWGFGLGKIWQWIIRSELDLTTALTFSHHANIIKDFSTQIQEYSNTVRTRILSDMLRNVVVLQSLQ